MRSWVGHGKSFITSGPGHAIRHTSTICSRQRENETVLKGSSMLYVMQSYMSPVARTRNDKDAGHPAHPRCVWSAQLSVIGRKCNYYYAGTALISHTLVQFWKYSHTCLPHWDNIQSKLFRHPVGGQWSHKQILCPLNIADSKNISPFIFRLATVRRVKVSDNLLQDQWNIKRSKAIYTDLVSALYLQNPLPYSEYISYRGR